MKRLLLGILCAITMNGLPATAADDPQTINPTLDKDLIARLKLWVPGTPVPDPFNILIVGQDNGNRNGRGSLSSRADIIMVLSLNRTTRKHNILSIYRETTPSSTCESRMGRSAGGYMINGVYSIMGRRAFIPCVEGQMDDLIANLPESVRRDVLGAEKQFKIHAFLEGTRTYTIGPLGQDLMGQVGSFGPELLGTYGPIQLGRAVGVVAKGKMDEKKSISYLIGSNPTAEEMRKLADGSYLSVELKERMVYPAGGYQRAFNLATTMTAILGWAGYGVSQYKKTNYDFMDRIFGAAINKHFSRSHDFKVLEDQVFKRGGEHILTQTCYQKGNSPVRVIQMGESASIYAIYSGGSKMYLPRMDTMLKGLTYVNIMPTPSDCN